VVVAVDCELEMGLQSQECCRHVIPGGFGAFNSWGRDGPLKSTKTGTNIYRGDPHRGEGSWKVKNGGVIS
jgi:hypothetical protein